MSGSGRVTLGKDGRPMSCPRIVLDTNVLISAALQPHGLPAKLLELIA
jgi:hypothetical protein